eukprot:scaffold5570_cov78-Cylindrotheca_fusiformis.AAC.2
MATTITIPRPRRAFPRRVEPTNDHQVQRPPQLPGSPAAIRQREIDITDGRIPKDSTVPLSVFIQQPVDCMPGATLSVVGMQSTLGVEGMPAIRGLQAPNDYSHTPPTRPTAAVEERRRATIRASSRSNRHHFDLDSRRRRTLLHQDRDVSEPELEEDSSELSTGAVVDEAEQQVIADDDDDDDDDDDGAPTRWEPKNNMMLGCKEGDELWCFKYGVMAFAMKGDYHAALALRDHFRRLFVRPLGGSVSLQCASCNRVLRYRPELIWHYQLGNCAETGDIPLSQCLGYGVSLVHFVQPFAIDIIQRTTFENNQRLDLLDPNLPTICNQFHPCQWTAHQEKKRENQYRSWKKANKTLGKIIKKKNDWYQQQVRYGSVPIGHMRMLRSDSYHFPFVKRFEDWTEAEKVAAGSQSP